MAALAFYLDSWAAALSVAAAVVHELGHWYAVRGLGGGVTGLHLSFIGAEMTLDARRTLSYPREILAALAGPAASIGLAWLAGQGGWFLLSGLSLSLGLLNLLPVTRLDGGRVLYAFAAWLAGQRAAEMVCRAVSILAAGCLIGLGIAVLRSAGNITLLLTALWLLGGVLRG